MPVQRFALADARLERSPGQDADIFAANVVDGRDGSPVSVGFGRYGPDQSLTETLAVNDVWWCWRDGSLSPRALASFCVRRAKAFPPTNVSNSRMAARCRSWVFSLWRAA